MFLLWSLLWLQDPVATIRESYLDLNQFITVGDGIDNYPFFEKTDWRTEDKNGKSLVVFRGVIDDAEAVKHFEENHKFHLDSNLKAMQLRPYYGLTDDKDKLAFVIHFLVHEDQQFDVRKGVLQIRGKESGEWRDKALTNKAVVEMIKGLFRKRNPYMSLIEGLPFK